MITLKPNHSSVDILVPPLLSTLGTSQLPTTLRTSSVSLLAQAIDTNSLALATYSRELCETMLDLIQIETVQGEHAVPAKKQVDSASNTADAENKQNEDIATGDSSKKKSSSIGQTSQAPLPSMNTQPTSTNSKFPPLRRAALHFIALLLRSITSRLYENSGENMDEIALLLHGRTLQRAVTVLGYVAETDQDDVVRVMAKEDLNIVDSMKKAMMGL